MPSSSRATVGTAATVLVAAASGRTSAVRRRVRIRNKGTVSVFLGGATVATTDGYEVTTGTSEDFTLDRGETLYAVAATPAQRVDVLIFEDTER